MLKRISIDNHIQINEMSPIDEEASNLFNFSDLTKSNLQQSSTGESNPPQSNAKENEKMDTEQQDQEMPESKSIIMGEIQNIVEQPQQQVQTICSGQTKFMDKNIEQTFLETTQQEEVVYQLGNHKPAKGVNNEEIKPQNAYQFCFDQSVDVSSLAGNSTPGKAAITPKQNLEKENSAKDSINIESDEPDNVPHNLMSQQHHSLLKTQFDGSLNQQVDRMETKQVEVDGWEERFQQMEHFYKERLAEAERDRDEAIKQLREHEQKLVAAETEIDTFEEIEQNMRLENFQLKKELVKLKLRFGLTTLEGACKELGCCATDFVDEIGEENVISS